MKLFDYIKLFLFSGAISVVMVACKKTETITVERPAACFQVLVPDPYSNFPSVGNTTFLDSNFYFQHCTIDTGAMLTYHWNFGDGNTSAENDPKHSYSKRGTYSVTMTVASNGKVYDTVQKTVSVIVGQQHISFGEAVRLAPIAIEETASNEFVLLASAGYGGSSYLFQLDSLLKQKSMKTFPVSYSFTSMQPTTDGNYIFTGSTLAANKSNELIKMKADGTVLWSKILSADDFYTNATETVDGGYAVTGGRPVPYSYGNTVIIKTDKDGNQQWVKLLNGEGMTTAKNAIAEPDGIVVAGVKRDVTNSCSDCDSVLIAKLDNNGNTVWKNSVFWGLNTSNWWNTTIAKLTNGIYAVSNEYTQAIFFFSPSGDFRDRKLMQNSVTSVTGTSDGNLVALQGGVGGSMSVAKITLDGSPLWSVSPDGRQKLPGGYSCCSASWPIALRPLRNGGFITTGYRVNNNTSNYGNYTVILLQELNEGGKLK